MAPITLLPGPNNPRSGSWPSVLEVVAWPWCLRP